MTSKNLLDIKKECDENVFDISNHIYSIQGMSNYRTRKLVNLVSHFGKNYFEIGTYLGSLFCSAINNNQLNIAYNLDWPSEYDRINGTTIGSENKAKLIENIKKTNHTCETVVLDSDAYKFDYESIKEKIDVFLYDGPHEKDNCLKLLKKIYPILDKKFIILVDDWSHQEQADAIKEFVKLNELKILCEQEFPSSGNLDSGNTPNYFNGFYVAELEKK